MLHFGTATSHTCQGVTRRELLQIGGLGALGLTLGDWLRCNQARGAGPSSRSREVSCIFIFLEGGPSQLETFDPKPNAPDFIRGPYGTIRTDVPGIQVSELLPMLAQRMKHCALIRTMRSDGNHVIQPVLTGSSTSRIPHGAVVTKLKGQTRAMPPYVHIGGKLFQGSNTTALGSASAPVEVLDPLDSQLQLPQLALSPDLPATRLHERTQLLGAVDQARAQLHAQRAVEQMDVFYQRAFDMLTSPKVRAAFDLSKEKEDLRNRYGANFFGQSVLMARRLIEAGTRFVQVKWHDIDGAWDIHGFNSTGVERMEQELCPRFDQGLSTLLDDLEERGLLRSTLVVAIGEMGRTPRLNHWAGRDHWGPCLSGLLAGGGVPGGVVVGTSDAIAGYPANDPVSPAEFAATLYRLLGIDTNTDPRIRPFIGSAAPVAALV
jgi:uncharacterized protein (DUF1501 family)